MTDLAVNLLAALIFFAAGLAVERVLRYFRTSRPAGKVWRNPRGARFSVVVADGPDDGKGSKLVHPAEFAAATEVSAFLAKHFRAATSRVSVAADFPVTDGLEGNLVVIGGPIRNAVYRAIGDLLPIPYEFDGNTLVSRTTKESFEPEVGSDGRPAVDYGLIVIAANPFNEKARVVLLAGCRTFGCLGAARAVVGTLLPDIARRINGASTSCVVVRMSVLAGYVGRVEIVEHVTL